MSGGASPSGDRAVAADAAEPEVSALRASIPSASGADVLAELKRRDPARYESCTKIGFTPGPEWDGSVEQIADAMQKVDREMENPFINCASRLGGEAFLLRDSAHQQTDYSGGFPGTPIPLTPEQKRYGRLADLLSEAEQLLRDAAQAIEARRAETGTGSVHESAVPKGCAQ